MGVISSFLLFSIGDLVFGLKGETLQSFVFLKLAIAGHFTLFAARTKGPFWSIKPSKILVGASVATQIIATIMAAMGLILAPIGWDLAVFIWAYSIINFLLLDFGKLLVGKWFMQ